MRSKLFVLGSMFIVSALLVAGCVPPTPTAQPVESPTATPTEAVIEAPEGVRAARDAVLAYVGEHYGEQAPASHLAWTEERTTAEGLVGGETFQYTATDWVVTISYPVVAPENVIYHIVVTNPTTGFRLEGEMDAERRLTETAPPVTGEPFTTELAKSQK